MPRILVVHGFPWVDECYGRFLNLFYLLCVDFNEIQCFESCLEYSVQGIQLPDYPYCVTKNGCPANGRHVPYHVALCSAIKTGGSWPVVSAADLGLPGITHQAAALCVTCFMYSFIIIIIIFPSFSVLLNCLYISPQVLPFSSFLPHCTAGQWENSWVVLSCRCIEPQHRLRSIYTL